MFSKFYRKDYLILMKATKILIIYSLIFILLNSTIVLAEQRNGIYEPLDYLNDNTPLSIAIPSSNAWKTEIAASEINSEWNDNDEFSIVNFDNADMSFDNNNVLTMTFNNVDYENGNLVVLLFHNKTKDEYSALQIDFSETGIPTFQSEIQRDRVMKNSLSRSGSIIVDGNIHGGWSPDSVAWINAAGLKNNMLQYGYATKEDAWETNAGNFAYTTAGQGHIVLVTLNDTVTLAYTAHTTNCKDQPFTQANINGGYSFYIIKNF